MCFFPRLLSMAALFGCGISFTPLSASEDAVDLLIRGGMIVDGTGGPMYQSDLAIRGELIVAIGDLTDLAPRAVRVIDANGLYVAPGFIDAHSHAGEGLADPARSVAYPQLAQGITTVAINPDGGGPVNLVSQREAFKEAGIGVNVAQLIGHNSVRHNAMGGSHDRPPTDAEMETMLALIREAMEEGSFGLTSGLFYTPGSFAETDEVIALARIIAEYDGVHLSHIRDESDYNIGVVASVQEIIDISRASGVAGVVSHIKCLGRNVWGDSQEIVRRIAEARADGVEVWTDQYPYHASSTGLASALIPAWAREGGMKAFRERLKDPGLHERIREETIENIARRGGSERIQIRSSGRFLDVIARTGPRLSDESDMEPVDAVLDILSRSSPSIISYNMDDEDIHRFMRQPFNATCTDGGLPIFGRGSPHPRTYGAFARKIRKYVREDQIIDLPQAIASMSGIGAQIFRLEDRGVLRPGAVADVVVFDFEAVNDPATYEDPHHYSEGMVYVLVNGELAIDEGAFTDVRAGRVLRHRGAVNR